MNYSKNYTDCINNGIATTEFRFKKNKLEIDEFFINLTKKTKEVQQKKGRFFFFGNGASAAFSNHMALDWSKNGGVLSYSLSDSSMLTAIANDYDFDTCFLEFLKINNPNKEDFVITTSSSGNSANVVNVLDYCKNENIPTLAFSGLNLPNKSANICDYSIHVKMKTYGMVECIHQIFHHLWLDHFMNIQEWNKKESQNMNSDNFKL